MAPLAESFFPIAELSAYQNKWTIKARVTNKAPLRTFAKGSGQGKVFHVELLDAQGGEIRASFFNNACDKFYDMLEKGKCFTFSRGTVKIANKRYNNTNHRYELTFDKDAVVEASQDDAKIETIKFSFVNLKAVAQRTLPAAVDICGVISSFKPIQTVNSKEGAELTKREITVADDTATSMEVCLWGDRATQPDSVFEGNPAVVIKGVLVKEFRESRNGSLLASGELMLNSTMAEAQRVKQWWTQGGSSQSLVDMSAVAAGAGGGSSRSRNATPTTLSALRVQAEALGFEPQIFSMVVRLGLVQLRKQGEPQALHYMACQEPKGGNGLPCNKRVDEQGFCAVCNRAGKVAPRLNVRCRFVDCEDQAWITSFHEAATKILGMSGEEIRALELAAAEKGEAGREALEQTIRQTYFDKPMTVAVRANLQTYNGEPRTNMAIIDARPVSRGEHGRQMLKEIHQLVAVQA